MSSFVGDTEHSRTHYVITLTAESLTKPRLHNSNYFYGFHDETIDPTNHTHYAHKRVNHSLLYDKVARHTFQPK